jgi:magnesium transporter
MPISARPFVTEQISIFILGDRLITLQEREGDCLDPVRKRIESGKGRIRTTGADYLAYAILDAIVDAYFPILEKYDKALGAIYDEVEKGLTDDIPKRLHDIRADLLNIRRVAHQHEGAIAELLREGPPIICEGTQPFLRDCLDHLRRLTESADTYRETCGELRELYFALLGQKTNDSMKVLSIIATVFIPMSLIAAIYGMNFDSEVSSMNMPELHWAFGYPFAIFTMLCTGGGLLFFLRRRGWL